MERCLNNAPASAVLHDYRPFMSLGLAHPVAAVRQLALGQLARCASDPVLAKELTAATLFMEVIATIADADTGVVAALLKLLLEMAGTESGLQALLQSSVLDSLQQLAATNSVTRLRVLDLYVQLCVQHPPVLHVSAVVPFFRAAADVRRDVLQATSSVGVLSPLACSEHGYRFLSQHGLLAEIFSALRAPRDSIEALLVPAVYQLLQSLTLCSFVNVAELQQQLPFVDALAQDVQAADPTLRNPAVVTASAIGCTAAGLALLLQHDDGLIARTLLRYAGVPAPPELQQDGLQAVAAVLGGRGDARAFFRLAEPGLLPRVVVTARNPFLDLRVAALGMLGALAQHEWGRETLAVLPGFLEYLTDRRTENSHAGKLAKFAVVKHMVADPRPPSLHDRDVLCLRELVLEGAFFMGREAAVAVDMDNM